LFLFKFSYISKNPDFKEAWLVPSPLPSTVDAENIAQFPTSVIFPSSYTWPMSTSAKRLQLPTVVTVNIRVNGRVSLLEGNIGM
jgi:hypothetical protein